jgi:hypothetical protein
MSALTYFEFRGDLDWKKVDELRAPIQMTQLMNLIVVTKSPRPFEFILLNRLLLLHVGAKRRMELPAPTTLPEFDCDLGFIDGLSPVVEAANGFRHIHFSGVEEEGWLHLWTGTAVTTWEDAEFCLRLEWQKARQYARQNLHHFILLFKVLGLARVRRLVVDSPSGLPKPYWRYILKLLPGIEELELYPASVDTLGRAWMAPDAPAVLPALKRVQIVDSALDHSSSQYAIVTDSPERRIVRLSRSTEDGATPFPEVISAEKELENMSKGLLGLLKGFSGRQLDTWA